ncbi:adenylate/guanylate cyclase domain-containing protein (plasmid) [Phyllobacterium sp. 628]|uniref:adenylate/guanylate cyclase domain-containing protein n=1 Tax=Phyllobacterium sp. 628 TaxID=2718938 RepID=UPI0016628870|nr:adenylate/guanylate cyclase domain-containing protein [Phyllobacterium sp. 628]QND55123.1 adenylate/guanylate cyclase domain-containing protein [Phyllobacterium sp. 628]
MSETRRKLTTIFSADVQDYTRLMQVDEERTLDTLKQYRDAMTRLIEAHHGRVINTWGDGLIAEFSSVVEAVRAAIDVQNELAGQNNQRLNDARMLFRIGINLGDVIVEGDDIYGDGVNVAARLQASAPAGGVVISSTVYDQVRNKMSVGFEYMGQLSLKNIEGGIPSYAVRIGESGVSVAQPSPMEHKRVVESVTLRGAQVETSAAPVKSRRGSYGVFGAVGAGLAAINALTWDGSFWAAWPLLALATASASLWVRTTPGIDRMIGTLSIVGLLLTAINLLTWSGTFWAAWPLIGLAVVGGIRWFTRQQGSVQAKK